MSKARLPVSALLIAKLAFLAFFFAGATLCHAQTDSVVCSRGTGSFGIAFRTGVTVEVGAARRDGLATRMCQATIAWDKRSLVVTDAAAQVDVDALGIDLGMGTPVVAFQVKRADADCCRTFLIYSLQKPPKLLRTITGGSFFSAADAELDGRIQIWTNDAASTHEFYDPNVERPELAPTVVLRFVQGRLLDVSSQFRGYFDNEIAALRGQLNSDDLSEFKNSDGRLPPTAHFSPEDLRRSQNLERTKSGVLRIVCSYLYSGREQIAWTSLEEMWPAADLNRIRTEILSARAKGILAQLDGVSPAGPSRAGLTKVYDIRSQSVETPDIRLTRRSGPRTEPPIMPPVPILIDRQAPAGQSEANISGSEILLDLTIDSAGKVRSVQSADPLFDASLKEATTRWKFLPAFNGHDPIASRIYLFVSPKR
jgi:hypothetical protein